MAKLGKKKEVLLTEEQNVELSRYSVSVAKGSFSVPIANNNFHQLEFYRSTAPYFCRSKAKFVIKADNLKSEILLFDECVNQELAKQLMEILIAYPISRAVLKNNQLIVKLMESASLEPSGFKQLIDQINAI